MLEFNFPVGYHHFHKTKIMDFQMNRWVSMGYSRVEDMMDAARNIQKVDDWKDEMIRQAKKARVENRIMNATFYYRAAEFFTLPTDPDKMKIYDQFIALFYNVLVAGENIERILVPYGKHFLPAMKVPAKGNVKKGTLVIHGGFDSFMEEFYSMAVYFSKLNYEVILFEGPGQGYALKKQGLPLSYEWEKPTSAILDYFELDDVTLLGISMGGWLCFRAAAYEPRIKRVIASSIAYDYMKIPPPFIEKFALWLFKHPNLMAWMSDLKMKMMPQEKWGIEHLMYITHTKTPLESGFAILEFNEEHLKSEMVKQDILILTGEKDHFIPVKMHHLQIQALKNAKSITDRIFTEKEQGQNHCQVGNMGLSLSKMAEWMDERV
ncbi:alpha/beta fold hydrolase [Chengkuizengella sediminis]|uniref:alpha/beta fold hydrolase n=1 Tax=Chengkuizengella sediminis TaxID=1885917 RepID=UPI00138A22B7|nr:alpha/beta fold hydrolase [Chengkuizengella sediminis]NDI33567.1 alpha/beta hydrolase [Chengkuizengella sediminis]